MTPPTLIGTYVAPAVRKGDRVFCLYRDCECVVSSWTDARISWPRVGVRGQQGGSGLWIDETLLRAIRTESATALKYWFGVGTFAVWRWRKAFGIAHTGTEGSKRLHHAASVLGAEGIKAKEWTAKERALKRKLSRGRNIPSRWAKTDWTAEMDAGSAPSMTSYSPSNSAERHRRSAGAARDPGGEVTSDDEGAVAK